MKPFAPLQLLLTVFWAGLVNAQPTTQTLPDLIRATLRTHPALSALQGEVSAAGNEVDAARWQYWPTPSIAVEQADKSLTAGTDRRVTVLSLKQPLWAGGRLDANLRSSEAGQAVAHAAVQEKRRDLALEVIQAYGEMQAADARSRILSASLETHNTLLERVRRRAAEGVSAESDIRLAETRRDAVQAELNLSETQRIIAVERLRALISADAPPIVPTESVSAPIVVPDDLAEAERSAHAIDPTTMRLIAESQQLKARADAARAALWPEVHAKLEQRHGDISGGQTRALVTVESHFGGGLSSLSSASAARERYNAKQGEIDARRRELSRIIRGDYLQQQNARARATQLAAALTSAQAVESAWNRQFLAGKKSWQDLMNATRETNQTALQHIDAQVAATTLAWRLAVLTQGVDSVLESQK